MNFSLLKKSWEGDIEGCHSEILKISNLIDQSLSTVDSRSETEGWIYEL